MENIGLIGVPLAEAADLVAELDAFRHNKDTELKVQSQTTIKHPLTGIFLIGRERI